MKKKISNYIECIIFALDEVFLSFIALGLCFFAIRIIGLYFSFDQYIILLEKLKFFGKSQYSTQNILVYFTIIILLVIIVNHLKLFKFSLSFLKNRSTLCIGAMSGGLFCAILTCYNDNNYNSICSLIFIGTMILFYTLYMCYRGLIRWQNFCEDKKNSENDNTFREEPIEDENNDHYGFYKFAKHYAEKMYNDRMQTFAILGGYGAGKSSFANLMWRCFQQLDKEEETIKVKIDTWGLPSNAIMGYIIKQIQSELSKFADTLQISDIDEKYQKIIFPGSPFLWGIFDFLKNKKSQANLLNDLDNFLSSIKKKIFIVIEDFDRLRNEELFANIAAFVDYIKKSKNIYVVIPVLNNSDTQIIIRCCIGCHYLTSIKGRKSTKEEMLNKLKFSERLNFYSKINQEFLDTNIIQDCINAISDNIETPRVLNTLINRVNMNWEKVCGNISYLDYCFFILLQLIKNDVRDGEYSAYTYIITNYDWLCHEVVKNTNNENYIHDMLMNSFSQQKNDEDQDNSELVGNQTKKVPENQQKLIISLAILAHSNPDGQHLLCDKYSNYLLFLETGIFNRNGEYEKNDYNGIEDIDIIQKISSINYNSDKIKDYIAYLENKKITNLFNRFSKELSFESAIEFCKYLSEDTLKYTYNSLIDIMKDKYNHTDENHINKINEILRFFLKNSLFGLKIFADIFGRYEKYMDLLFRELEQYLCDKDNSINFIEKLRDNKKLLFSILYNWISSQHILTKRNKWIFLGEWFKNYIYGYPSCLLPSLNDLCTGGYFLDGKKIMFNPKFFLFFISPYELMNIYNDDKINDNLQETKQLKKEAKEYIDEFKKNTKDESYNRFYVNKLKEKLGEGVNIEEWFRLWEVDIDDKENHKEQGVPSTV